MEYHQLTVWPPASDFLSLVKPEKNMLLIKCVISSASRVEDVALCVNTSSVSNWIAVSEQTATRHNVVIKYD